MKSVCTYCYSYYQRDSKGKYIVKPGFVADWRKMDIEKTAIFIIDPWQNTAFPAIDEICHNNIKSYVAPFLEHYINRGGGNVYVFTNNPDTLIDPEDRKVSIDNNIVKYIDNSKVNNITNMNGIFYECSSLISIPDISQWNTNNIIYMGYALNMCVLFRPTGIIPIWNMNSGLDLYVVPEATCAFANTDGNRNLIMKEDVLILLAQNNIARIINYADLIAYEWNDKEK